MMDERPSDELLARISERLKALSDPMRLKILHELEAGEVCVGSLAERVGGSQANVSKHLGVLKSQGLVRCRREGMNVCYSLEDASVFDVCRLVRDALVRQADRAAEELRRETRAWAEPGRGSAGAASI